MSAKAKFVYWQEGWFGEPPAPRFEVLGNGSTVTGEQLLQTYQIPLPLFPDLKTWRRLVLEKKKCGRCFTSMRSPTDLANHYQATNRPGGCGAWALQQQRHNHHASTLGGFMKNAKLLLIVLLSVAAIGCRQANRILHGPDPVQGAAYNPPTGDPSAKPFYEQSVATSSQDAHLIAVMIGAPGSANFNLYVSQAFIVDRLNGIHNLGNGSRPYSSLLVDAWKALGRQGYLDLSRLKDPAILHNDVYPVPVYQDDPKDWGLL